MVISVFISSGASTGPVLAPEPIKTEITTVSFSLDALEFITNHEMVGIIPGIFRRWIKNGAVVLLVAAGSGAKARVQH